ncbi:maltotransferase domain-containing protein, partial [Streptomyces sp. NPDC002667]|uniref:maltotransferase domain-containing protein n=1 Tax=Streptomyces sp. NPDC002667 TaxID=3364657 RepID=UPI00368110A3
MPATHHTSPPPTTTPETPLTRAAGDGPRTPEKPSTAPGASGSGARSVSAGASGPRTSTPPAGTPAPGTPSDGTPAVPETASSDASAAGTSARRGAAAGPGTAKSPAKAARTAAAKTSRPSKPSAAKPAKTTKPSAAKTVKTSAAKTVKTAKTSAAKPGKAVAPPENSAPRTAGTAPKAGRAAVPATRTPDAGDGPLTTATAPATAVGRIPVLDVHPVVQQGRRPAKAVVGEEFEVSATVFREGHDAVAANVVLRDPDGRPGPWTPMRELAPGTDRWGARVSAGTEGRWTYTVEAWGDPVSTWRHHAGIKIPAGLDTELVLEEGALLYERAAAGLPEGARGRRSRDTVLGAVDALRDTGRPVASRLAAALTPEVDAVLAEHPLRDLVTSSEPLPLLVERERALFGAWYEFFPRSENGRGDAS